MNMHQRLSIRVVPTCWAFGTWTPDRLYRVFTRHVPIAVDPIFIRPRLRAPSRWCSDDEIVATWDTPTGVPWSLAVARQWERIATRIEAATCPWPIHVLAGDGLDRLLALTTLGTVCRAPHRGVYLERTHTCGK